MQDQNRIFSTFQLLVIKGLVKQHLLNKLQMEGTFNQYPRQTILMSLEFKTIVVRGREHTLRFLNNSGNQSYSAKCQQFYQQAHFCLIVYDLTDQCGLQKLNVWIDPFLYDFGSSNPKGEVPNIIVGTHLNHQFNDYQTLAVQLNIDVEKVLQAIIDALEIVQQSKKPILKTLNQFIDAINQWKMINLQLNYLNEEFVQKIESTNYTEQLLLNKNKILRQFNQSYAQKS